MKRGTVVNLLLLAAVAALAIAPFAIGAGDGEKDPFTGSDSQAESAITENDPHYKPWFRNLYRPPSGEIESGLFALQAAAGAGVLGYALGVYRTRRRLTAGGAAGEGAQAERPGAAG